MFSRRSGRPRRQSRLGLFGRSIRSSWSHSNAERVFGLKRDYSRRLAIETLEDRRLLTVNVYFDNVNNQISIVDDYADDALQTAPPFPFNGANNIQEDNDVTLSNGIATPGRLRITDPLGVILEPNVIIAGAGTQISPTEVEVDSTAIVRVDLQGGNDRLTFASNFNAVATLATLNAHGGDPAEGDELIMNATAGVAETVTVAVDNMDHDEQDITGYAGKTLILRGYESILYAGSGIDDNLNVDLGFGVATARVQNAAALNTDEVISSTLPRVLFNGLNSFTLVDSEVTTATFVNGTLQGAATHTFNSSASTTDTLIIEGSGGADSITASMNGANLRVVSGGHTLETLGMGATDLLQVLALGGNDTLTINVTAASLILTPIFYDGGSGADKLIVDGAFDGGAGDTTSVTYTPGLQVDEGRLLYTKSAPAQTMDITFDNMEPVVDTTTADTLTVNGNGAANAITVIQDPAAATRGLVSIDGFETISFNNKTGLVINSLGGDDIVNVNIAAGALITGLATVTVNANDGNDTVRFQNLPTAAGFTGATVNAGAGNDTIDASNIPTTTIKPLTLNGDEGNDTITGGPNGDTISGGAGDDTLIDSPGADIYSGNGGIDTLVIRGTVINDILSAVQLAPSAVVGANYELSVINGRLATPPAAVTDQITTTNAGLAPSNAANLPTIERILIEALAGDDYIAVSQNDAYSDLNGANGIAAQTITMQVIGDSPNASDRLVVQDNGPGDLVIHREGPDGRSGSIVVGGMAPITYESTERVDITPLNNLGQTGTDQLGRLIVFKYDDFETNESETNATPLGLEPTFVGLRNIDPGGLNLPPFGEIPGDQDWYEFRPQISSTFRFQIFFEHIGTLANGRPGLPGDGNLRLDAFRANGTLIASSDSSVATPINVDSKESVDISLNVNVTESIFIRVQGAALPLTSSPAINNYDILVTNVDTEGPVVFNPPGPVEAIFPNNIVDFNLFAPKPDNLLAGATPPIFSLTINIEDLPIPAAPGDPLPALNTQSASQPGIYRLVGDHVGIIDISSVEVLNNFQVAGVVNGAPAPTTLTFRDPGLVGANLPPLTGQQTLVGDFIQFTSGANSGQIRTITAYDPATGQITVNAALPFAPAAGDTFTITSSNNAQVRLNFREPLPDDRYTLTILDSITDPAGNRLDGESDAAEPGIPTFPSGNGVPGGNFVARFTVDTRPEIGSSVAQDIDVDINGNYVWDPANAQIGNDTTNIDLSFTMAVQFAPNGPLTNGGFNVNDLAFAGRFTNNGVVAGLPNRLYDMLGVYGNSSDITVVTAGQRWLIDLNGDGIVTFGSDIVTSQPSLGTTFNVAGAIPIAGNFDGNKANGDEIGLFNAGKWGLDTNRNFIIDAGEVFTGSITGVPIVGDFDGDGLDDLATFNNNTFFFDFKANGFGGNDASFIWGFPGVTDRPIAADIDQDGIDDVGLWVPRNSASVPREVSEWYFLISDSVNAPVTDRPELVTDNATTTSFFATNLIGANAATINGKLIRFLSGANAGQVRTVIAFNSATGQVTFSGALATAPLNGDLFAIGGTTNTLELLNHAYSPTPFGFDVYAEFGDELALPLVGNFDPPTSPTYIAPNTGIMGDYDNSGGVTSADYSVWRANFGSTTNLLADGSHNAQVDAGDFVLWRKAPKVTGSGSSQATTQTAMALEIDSPSTVSSVSAAAGVLEVSPASATSSTLAANGTSFGITTTIETVSVAAPSAVPAVNIAVLDSAFSNMVPESPKKVVGARISPDFSTFDDNLLLLGMSEYSQRPTTLPLGGSVDEAAAPDDEAFDSALTDFAVDAVLELAT